VVITGANSGIGLETAVALASVGDRVVICCRDAAKAETAAADIRTRAGSDLVEVVALDLGSFASIRSAASDLAERTPTIDVLVNNAGITVRAPERTVEDHDVMLATNQLGPYLLTEQLRPLLTASAPARVVNVASHAHRFVRTVDLDHLDAPAGYGPIGMRRYGETKLMNILWTRELARRLASTAVTANAVHPGGVRSNLGNPAPWQRALVHPFMIPADRGAATSVFVATDPGLAETTGGYFAKSRPADGKLTAAARDDALARRLWEACASLTAA
jgi:NAD(P)-dependent dehydrogenase (short-subunit alcohol dehydrogenase family)